MEDGYGFIQDELDKKLLILFVLRHLPAYIDGEKLADLVLIDGGIGYFDYKDCLAQLVDSMQVEESSEGYKITAKGSRNCEILESGLAYSVRMKAEKLCAPVAEEMRRSELILANHELTDKGVIVYLSLDDGLGSIFDLKILAGDEAQAGVIEKNFKKNAEEYYKHFISELSERSEEERK